MLSLKAFFGGQLCQFSNKKKMGCEGFKNVSMGEKYSNMKLLTDRNNLPLEIMSSNVS